MKRYIMELLEGRVGNKKTWEGESREVTWVICSVGVGGSTFSLASTTTCPLPSPSSGFHCIAICMQLISGNKCGKEPFIEFASHSETAHKPTFYSLTLSFCDNTSIKVTILSFHFSTAHIYVSYASCSPLHLRTPRVRYF